jgi:putative transposase
MARPLRLQFEGARYHVINRGNYRADVFRTPGAISAFETALRESCQRYAWQLHAYAIMRNHFHLALETPRPNLVDGMHWLQSTFATRFNRYRREQGHLFQGRYQALLIENAAVLVRVIDYIHLNPVRAGLVSAAAVASYHGSSLRHLIRSPRPEWLTASQILTSLRIDDTVPGWSRYLAGLMAAAEQSSGIAPVTSEFSSGWAIGSSGWRRAIARQHTELALNAGFAAAELRDFKLAAWGRELVAALREIGRSEADLIQDAKGAAWKIALARRLRERAGAPHRWIADALHMGSAASVRVYVCRGINKLTA